METQIITPASTVADEMRRLLTVTLAPTKLDIINDSARHYGHSGDDGSGETHFSLVIESAAFTGHTRLARQRMVLSALGDIPGGRVHALTICTLATGEGEQAG